MPDTSLINDLMRQARGRVTIEAPLGPMTWFRVGGAADILFRPADTEDLAAVLHYTFQRGILVTVLGVGSNTIVRDKGVSGVVIKLAGRSFSSIVLQDTFLEVGGGALDRTVAEHAAQHNIAGLEFYVGIPGTLGGAVYMNAGAYGAETCDVLTTAEIVTPEGDIRTLTHEECGFSYRSSHLPASAIVTRAVLKGRMGEEQEIQQLMQHFLKTRELTQPTRARTGGSTFKNPPGFKAWELIDQAGCRGLVYGGAQVSPLHCNFLINTGDATASDIETLGDMVRDRVYQSTQILLEWEIKRIGRKGDVER